MARYEYATRNRPMNTDDYIEYLMTENKKDEIRLLLEEKNPAAIRKRILRRKLQLSNLFGGAFAKRYRPEIGEDMLIEFR